MRYLLLFMIILTVGCAYIPNQNNSLKPPPNFQMLAKIDLSSQSYDGEIIGQFTLAETAVVGIVYTMPNIDTSYFELSLIGSKNGKQVILHSENFQTDANGSGTWENSLVPGTYQLALSSDKSPSNVIVYWGLR